MENLRCLNKGVICNLSFIVTFQTVLSVSSFRELPKWTQRHQLALLEQGNHFHEKFIHRTQIITFGKIISQEKYNFYLLASLACALQSNCEISLKSKVLLFSMKMRILGEPGQLIPTQVVLVTSRAIFTAIRLNPIHVNFIYFYFIYHFLRLLL